MDTESPVVWPSWCYAGESATEAIDSGPQLPAAKLVRKRRLEQLHNGALVVASTDYAIHNNNNNHVKSERLSPGTPDVSGRSRSITPSPASHPGTPPAAENHPPPLPSPATRIPYSELFRNLAAKYNNANPNDFYNVASRNGLPSLIDHRYRMPFPNMLPTLPSTPSKEPDTSTKQKLDPHNPVLNPYNPLFNPLIDMSTTQALIAIAKTAREQELQNLLKTVKRQDASSPLDLSAGAPAPKRVRVKASCSPSTSKRAQSESPKLQEDLSSWTVDDVCNFVASIDICAEYVENFRNQRIDGAGLPLLTEEHLTTTMNMKLGPALKLRALLAKKLGSCNICLHCTHCHNNTGSPDPNTAGNTSDSGGAS